MGTQIRLKTCEDMSALWISFIKLGQTLKSHKPLKQDIFKWRQVLQSRDIWPEWGRFHESVNSCETFRQLWKMLTFCRIFLKHVFINVKWGHL